MQTAVKIPISTPESALSEAGRTQGSPLHSTHDLFATASIFNLEQP